LIAYAFVLLADILSPAFNNQEQKVEWRSLTLVVFVLMYLLSDSVEARLLTERVPYEGRGRFSVDLFISLSFFLAFGAAAHASTNFLIPFACVFFLGAIWAVYLHHDTKTINGVTWSYPKGVVLSHIAAGVIWLGYWSSLRSRNVLVLGEREILHLLFYYAGWLALTTCV